jgi:glycosyltransferase involved in cell wall biosynthesis
MDPVSGGVAMMLRNLLPELNQKGVSSEVLCFDAPLMTDVVLDEGYEIHRIGPSSGRWGRVDGFHRWLDTHADRFNVVVLHGLWLYNGYAYTKWLRRRKSILGRSAPLTWVMPHGMLDPWFQRAVGRRLKAVRNYIYWTLIEKDTIASADLLIFTSEAEREKAAVTFPGYKPKHTAILPLGVPDPYHIFSEDSGSHPTNDPNSKGFLLALGRIDPKKGFDLLPEVWQRLRQDKQYRDRLPNLLIAGPGWNTYYGDKLKARITELNLDDCISTSGMLVGKDKWDAFKSCEAFIMPSHQENFGLVAAEALACGTPVLMSNQIDIFPMIVDGNAGMADADSVEGLERLLRKWMDLEYSAREKMKVSARALFIHQFDIRKTANCFIELLEKLGN